MKNLMAVIGYLVGLAVVCGWIIWGIFWLFDWAGILIGLCLFELAWFLWARSLLTKLNNERKARQKEEK